MLKDVELSYQYAQACARAREAKAVGKELKQEINRTAYHLAQQQFNRVRRELEAQCMQMVKDGSTEKEVRSYLLKASMQGKQ